MCVCVCVCDTLVQVRGDQQACVHMCIMCSMYGSTHAYYRIAAGDRGRHVYSPCISAPGTTFRMAQACKQTGRCTESLKSPEAHRSQSTVAGDLAIHSTRSAARTPQAHMSAALPLKSPSTQASGAVKAGVPASRYAASEAPYIDVCVPDTGQHALPDIA
jgi:hypothetical protein